MSIEAVFVQNMPVEITGEEVLQQCVEQLPEVFAEAQQRNRLSAFTFPGRLATDPWSAVIKGFSFDFELLQLYFRGLVFRHGNDRRFKFTLKPDTGEVRDEQGNFLVNMPGGYRNDLQKLCGQTNNKVVNVFEQPFLRSVNKEVFNGYNIPFVMEDVKPWDFLDGERDHPGFVQIFRLKDKKDVLALYGSPLENLQAIAYFNRNPTVVAAESNIPQVCSVKNTAHKSSCNRRQGLGMGAVIDIGDRALNLGYVSLKDFDKRLINWAFVRRVGESTLCVKCDTPFEILGVNHNLNYLSATCGGCLYDGTLRPTEPQRGIFFEGEKFTRLMMKEHANFDNPLEIPAIIMFPQVRRIYQAKKIYLETMLPLIFTERKREVAGLQTQTQREGRITRLVVLEQHELEEGQQEPTATVALSLSFPYERESKFWQENNPASLKEVNISIERMQRERPVSHSFNCKLYKIDVLGTNVILRIKTRVPLWATRVIPTNVLVYGLANKSEYISLKKVLALWEDGAFEHVLADLILNPIAFPSDSLELPINAITLRRNGEALLDRVVAWVNSNLNAEQRAALWAAVRNSISLLQGPPGTGKTFIAAAIIFYLFQREVGKFVMTAPSNLAVDNLAIALARVQVRGCNSPRILRVYARSLEEYPIRFAPAPTRYGVLHALVQQHATYLQGQDFDDIRDIVNGNNFAELTDDQEKLYWSHVRAIETSIMMEYDVICLTVGALADFRVEKWVSKIKVGTVILDEAGQLANPAILHTLRLNPKRLVIIGDHQQLQHQTVGMEAFQAGYEKSFLEMCLYAQPLGDRNFGIPPYTMLLEQHRMHPDICHLVSEITYQGRLRCANNLIRGRNQAHVAPLELMYDNKRVILLDHKSPESKRGDSCANSGEASLIVVEINAMLQNPEVSQNDIIVVTLYEAQKKDIERRLLELGINEVKVQNADAIQGREYPIVFVSFVRSNSERRLGFLTSPNRINVALSRAQDFLIIGGNMSFYQETSLYHWRKFSQVIQEMKQQDKVFVA